jgi:glyoxalase family protein
MTFFPWENAVSGSNGVGMVTCTAFSIPTKSVGYWVERFVSHGLHFEGPLKRMDETVLRVNDPDGLPLELIGATGVDHTNGWGGGSVPAEHAIRSFHSASLGVWEFDVLETLFTETFGYEMVSEEGNRRRFSAPGEAHARMIDLVSGPGPVPPRQGKGTIHHIAFRAKDEEEQLEWREKVLATGLRVTEVRDRQYFKSIYFREPGGILFEIATDPPGFTADESPTDLGTSLKLPPWLEERRAEIEASLPEL